MRFRGGGRGSHRYTDREEALGSRATWAIEAGVQLWHLATIMGTSVFELEDTYGRWLKRTDEQLRATLNAYDETFGHGLGTERAENPYADERT